MTALKIVLGNKNYSSWSLRPWLVLKHLGVPFEEVVIPLDQPQTRQQILRYSPSGRVPVLLDGDLAVWDSLAICEYLHEKFPERHLWPADAKARATARSVSAEMHSGFPALRQNLPMKFRESLPMQSFPDEVRRDIERIFEIWTQCRRRFGGGEPFLFGAFSIADAMYGPVVSRFRTYAVKLEGAPAEYVETMLALPAMKDWLQAARAEIHRMARYEVQKL